MANQEDPLKIITDAKFTPLTKGDQELTVSNFGNLRKLNLSPGSEIEVEGYVTYVSKVHKGKSVGEQDLDVHFNLSPAQDDATTYLVCEIQNADDQKHKQKLDDAKSNGAKVKVKGVLRIFLEHIYESRQKNQFPHIFELHPVSSVIIGGEELADITMDCPDMDNWRNNDSIYEMKLQADGSVLFKKPGQDWKSFPESVEAEFDGMNLTLRDVHTVGHNYVYMDGYFSKIQNGSFPDGEPYFFELKSADDDSIRIKSVVIPGVPAYDIAKVFHNNPPDSLITSVAVRNLNIPQLMDNIYETILYPVFRLEQNSS